MRMLRSWFLGGRVRLISGVDQKKRGQTMRHTESKDWGKMGWVVAYINL
jgi:hypothetical protein